MTLYLDCEFNGYRGELISMAMVGSDGAEWYEVLDGPWCWPRTEGPVPWVKEHILPVLGKAPIPYPHFKHVFVTFIKAEAAKGPLVIVADWPEDIVHFCQMMIGPNGGQILVWPTFRLVDSPELHPEIPHNALSDARALRDAYHVPLYGDARLTVGRKYLYPEGKE